MLENEEVLELDSVTLDAVTFVTGTEHGVAFGVIGNLETASGLEPGSIDFELCRPDVARLHDFLSRYLG